MAPQVKERFLNMFAQPLSGAATRRIVIWHDVEREFEEEFDDLSKALDAGVLPSGSRPLYFVKTDDRAQFSLKRRMLREDTEADFALWRPRASGDIAGDFLADIECFAEHFQADGLSLVIQELAAADTPEVREAVAATRPFFAAKDRTERFKALVPQAQTAADVRAGVLAVTLGAEDKTAQAITEAFIVAALSEKESGNAGTTYARLERYGASDALRRTVTSVTGFSGEITDIDALVTHLLLTAFSATVPESLMKGLEGRYAPQYAQFCLGIVHDMADSPLEQTRSLILDAASEVEYNTHLPQRFSEAEVSSLLASDVFPGINRALVTLLASSLAQGADRREDVRRVVAARRNLAGWDEVACYFDALGAACAMQDFLLEHAQGFHEAPAVRVWQAYTNDWWRMDSAYRHFCEAWQRCVRDADGDLVEAVQPVADWADAAYTKGFLAPANECWVSVAEQEWEREGYVTGIPRQDRFYDDVVENELAGAKRVVVVVSDALRYEVAEQLGEELERRLRVECECFAVQGAFPSITPFGMAALLPHRRRAVDESSLAVTVDGLPTATREQRQAVLQARRPASVALRADDLLELKAADQREVARGAEVIYIYHDVIDATGEARSTQSDVFGACERAVGDLCALVKVAINRFKASRIVVTADHGFIYTRQPLGEAEKLSVREIESSLTSAKERFALTTTDPEDDVLIALSLTASDGNEIYGLAPRGLVRLVRPGGASHYVHGGISLEELCVPVLKVRAVGGKARSAAAAAKAEVRLVDAQRKITSMLFGVKLYQSEPVGAKVVPATYELVMEDALGNPVSDRRQAVADRTDGNEQARVMEVRFALREGRAYRSGDPYFLVAREKDTACELFREPFVIDIAFAPLDDFGF